MIKTQKWQDTWNIARSSFGIADSIRETQEFKNNDKYNIAAFPVILLKDLFKV